MVSTQEHLTETCFSKQAVDQQLERIFSDPLFASSEILKRFLTFVVEETLSGRANTIKEYTIGTQVLNKSLNFTPQSDAIVRIHAGRLRRALHQYYEYTGKADPICISIPTGSYVPAFSAPQPVVDNEVLIQNIPLLPQKKNIVIAVAPFSQFESDAAKISFTHALGVQLSTELSHTENCSVIAYYTMCRIAKQTIDIKEIAAAVGVQYVFTGDVQFQKDNCRVNIQLIDTSSSEQVWGRTYKKKFSVMKVFDIQDDIVRDVISFVERHGVTGGKEPRIVIATVA